MLHKFIYTLILISAITACQSNNKKSGEHKTETPKIVFKKQGQLKILDSAGQEKARFDIEMAKDAYHRETGLMYRRSMKDAQAMLFIFEDVKPRYFWMKNTYIPLDIIYIGPDKKIVSIVKEAKVLDETALPSKEPAQYVLEIKAGLADRYHIKKGDRISWQEL